MNDLAIVRLGHPSLRTKSKPVSLKEIKTPSFQTFLDNLIAICKDHDGVGIAAPQVGINKRIIVVTVDPTNPRYEGKQAFPTTVVINPKITSKGTAIQEDWEGDLSADIRGLVPRHVSCTVTGLDRNGQAVAFNLIDDFHARVFQHEIDHLDGVLFLDKVKRMKSLSEYETWKIYFKGKDLKTLNL